MKYRLVKISQFSGNKASVYSIQMVSTGKTLFDEFIAENKITHINEIKDILIRLKSIGQKTGAGEQFFKIDEGVPGDGVCALFDKDKKKLRLYCIRYGSLLVILGSGGIKQKNIIKLQESEKLTETNYFLRDLSAKIKLRTKDGSVIFSKDGMDLTGNLEFNDEENE